MPSYIKGCLVGSCLCAASASSHAQTLTIDSSQDRRFYLGLEGVIFANRPTRLTQAAPYLAAADRDLAPRPALFGGYRVAPRLALEVRVQDLAVLTGYSYQQELASAYLGFGQSYTQDYLYVPMQAVWRVTGVKSCLSLSVVAGGGPAWTDTGESLLTPNGTEFFTSAGNGTIGAGSAPGPGVITATITQRLTQQKGFLVGLEAGLRGSWQVRPRLGADLTVRQLWSTASSARDIDLTIQTDTQLISTKMQTPVHGICTGLSIHYAL